MRTTTQRRILPGHDDARYVRRCGRECKLFPIDGLEAEERHDLAVRIHNVDGGDIGVHALRSRLICPCPGNHTVRVRSRIALIEGIRKRGRTAPFGRVIFARRACLTERLFLLRLGVGLGIPN